MIQYRNRRSSLLNTARFLRSNNCHLQLKGCQMLMADARSFRS